jgi:hypothetical protein
MTQAQVKAARKKARGKVKRGPKKSLKEKGKK